MISDERLELIARGDWKCVRRDEFDAIARELLALRKAFNEPFCFTDDAGLKLHGIGTDFSVWPVENGDINIPLYRKPTTD